MNSDIQAIGLDIGTSKVRCVVGEPGEDSKMNIIGIGEADSRGLRRGIVTAAEAVSESVRKAVGEAERVSGLDIRSAVVNLSGEHFRGENKNGVVAVAGAGREITEEDVERAIESASAMQLPAGWEIINRLPQVYAVGEKHQIRLSTVFHAGDGNLHPNINFDGRNEDEVRRVTLAGKEFMKLCVEAGGPALGRRPGTGRPPVRQRAGGAGQSEHDRLGHDPRSRARGRVGRLEVACQIRLTRTCCPSSAPSHDPRPGSRKPRPLLVDECAGRPDGAVAGGCETGQQPMHHRACGVARPDVGAW